MVKLVWLDQVGAAQAVRQEDSLLVVPIAMIPAPAIFTIPRLVAVQHTRGNRRRRYGHQSGGQRLPLSAVAGRRDARSAALASI